MHAKISIGLIVVSALALVLMAGCPAVESVEAQNMQVVRDSYEKLWNLDDETQFDDLIQIPGYVHHESDRADVVFTSYEQLDAGFDAAQQTIPDLHYTIDRIFAEGDEVVVQWTASGTFTNDYGPIPATGEQVSYTGFTVYTLKDGKIIESYTEDDDQDILEAFTNTDIDNSGIIAGDVP